MFFFHFFLCDLKKGDIHVGWNFQHFTNSYFHYVFVFTCGNPESDPLPR